MDDGPFLSSIILIIVLLLLAALFALIETAFSSVSKNKIKTAINRGDYRGKKAMFVLDNFERAISTLLICTNIVHISAAAIVTAFVSKNFGLGFVTLSTILTTIIVFFVGEMLPKSIAKKNPTKISLTFAGLLGFLMKVFYPLSILLSKLGEIVANKTKGDPEVSVTEDELHDIIEDMAEGGSIDEDQEDLISSVLDFTDQDAMGIMTPLKDTVMIDINANPKLIFETISKANHSRLPVYERGVANIVGILDVRTYMRAYLESRQYPDIRNLVFEPVFAKVGMPADELLSYLSSKKSTIAIIRNRNNKPLGIVTTEDILEEIVGEVFDEEDALSDDMPMDANGNDAKDNDANGNDANDNDANGNDVKDNNVKDFHAGGDLS